MRRLTMLAVMAFGLLTYSVVFAEAEPVQAPATTTTTVVTTTTPPTTATIEPHFEGGQEPPYHLETTTTTTTVAPLPEGKCSEWYQTALDVGWSEERLPLLGRIMYAESRCLPDVRGSGSYGLAQMQYSAHKHWMKSEFGITSAEELYDPALNLATALWLAEYAEEHYSCWAQPWYMSGDWC